MVERSLDGETIHIPDILAEQVEFPEGNEARNQ